MKIIHINTENAEPNVRLASTAWSPAGLASPHPFLLSCRSHPLAGTCPQTPPSPRGTESGQEHEKGAGHMLQITENCKAKLPEPSPWGNGPAWRCFPAVSAQWERGAPHEHPSGGAAGWCALGEQDRHAALRTNLVGDNFCNRKEMTDP